MFSVNGIAFNRQFGTFATYGQDGSYFFWNKDTKSKLRNTKPGVPPFPVTAADFLENCKFLMLVVNYIAQ